MRATWRIGKEGGRGERERGREGGREGNAQCKMIDTFTHPSLPSLPPSHSLFYDLVFLGVRAALLLPLLATHSGFVQSMIMLSMTGLYYFYYRGNSPFIKFEDQDDVEHPNLHYRAEESKVCVLID